MTAAVRVFVHETSDRDGRTDRTFAGLGAARCFVLTLRRTHLLLDCGLWTASGPVAWLHAAAAKQAAQHVAGQPEPAGPGLVGPCLQMLGCFQLEAALLTTAESVLAIPYLMAQYPGQQLIQGPIYATIAALDAARHIIAELAHSSSNQQSQTSIVQPSTAAAPATATGVVHAAAAGIAAESLAGMGSAGASSSAAATQQQDSTGGLLHDDPCCQAGRSRAAQACGAAVGGEAAKQVCLACWQDLTCLMDTDWVEACLNKIKAVRYGQAVPLDGVDLTARAFPSGASMGAALWIITDGCRSIGYMSDWRLPFTPGVCLELEPQTLSHLDVLITAPCCLRPAASSAQPQPAAQAVPQLHIPGAGSLIQLQPAPPAAIPAQPVMPQQAAQQHMAVLQQMQQAVMSTVMQGGNVLIPLPCNGAAWGVLEDLASMLQSCQVAGRVSLVYISPAAKDSLALAASSMEFLSRAHQARPPGMTLPFSQLQTTNKLIIGSGLSDAHVQQALQQPCVVIASVASLAGGDAYQLLSSWCKNSPASVCLLTGSIGCEPEAMLEALQSAMPQLKQSRVRCIHLDLGGPPPASHLMSLLSQLQPSVGQLVMSQEDMQQIQPWLHASRSSTICHTYSWLDRLVIKLPKYSRQVDIAPQLLQRLQWVQLDDDQGPAQAAAGSSSLVAARLTGLLKFSEGRWHMDAAPPLFSSPTPQAIAATALAAAIRHQQPSTAAGSSASASDMSQVFLGQPHVDTVVQALAQKGITDVQIVAADQQQTAATSAHQAAGPHVVILVPQLEAEILLYQGGATIRGPTDALTQQLLASCVTSELTRL